ncbi:hypothetical protein K438DRAFT_1790511 [Mycena galopus ATCC 62051]|nr:hypothetical protein K438DRAFT_1790511 [Mycena galopus ATCC 62051]
MAMRASCAGRVAFINSPRRIEKGGPGVISARRGASRRPERMAKRPLRGPISAPQDHLWEGARAMGGVIMLIRGVGSIRLFGWGSVLDRETFKQDSGTRVKGEMMVFVSLVPTWKPSSKGRFFFEPMPSGWGEGMEGSENPGRLGDGDTDRIDDASDPGPALGGSVERRDGDTGPMDEALDPGPALKCASPAGFRRTSDCLPGPQRVFVGLAWGPPSRGSSDDGASSSATAKGSYSFKWRSAEGGSKVLSDRARRRPPGETVSQSPERVVDCWPKLRDPKPCEKGVGTLLCGGPGGNRLGDTARQEDASSYGRSAKSDNRANVGH